MNKNELLLKTIFCCMACDGEIADSEIQLAKNLTQLSDSFGAIDVEALLNSYVEAINQDGQLFISQYLKEVKETYLTDEEAIKLIDFAISVAEFKSLAIIVLPSKLLITLVILSSY